jgi:hypothetical protein
MGEEEWKWRWNAVVGRLLCRLISFEVDTVHNGELRAGGQEKRKYGLVMARGWCWWEGQQATGTGGKQAGRGQRSSARQCEAWLDQYYVLCQLLQGGVSGELSHALGLEEPTIPRKPPALFVSKKECKLLHSTCKQAALEQANVRATVRNS